MKIIYQSDTVINFLFNGELYNIPKADMRFNDIVKNIDNPSILRQLIDFSLGDSDIVLYEQSIQECYNLNNINFLTLKDLCFNLYKNEGKTEKEINRIISKPFIPVDNKATLLFCKSSDKINSKYFISIPDSNFHMIKEHVKESFLSSFNINKRQNDFCILLKEDHLLSNFIMIQLETNEDKLYNLLSQKAYLSNNIIPITYLMKIKEMLLFSYPKDRLINQLLKSNINWLEDKTYLNFSRLLKNGFIQPKRCNSIREYLDYINKTYDKVVNSFELALLESHPCLFNLNQADCIFQYNNKEYQIIFPKNKQEVIQWGNLAKNCFGSRSNAYFSGNNLLFGIISPDTPPPQNLLYVSEYIYRNKSLGDFDSLTFRPEGNRSPTNNDFKQIVLRILTKIVTHN